MDIMKLMSVNFYLLLKTPLHTFQFTINLIPQSTVKEVGLTVTLTTINTVCISGWTVTPVGALEVSALPWAWTHFRVTAFVNILA